MIFADGKLLFSLGCPPKKIKFFVGKSFESEEELIKIFSEELPKENTEKKEWPKNCAFSFLKTFDHLPMAFNGELPIKASNSEIRRWLESGSVEINGEYPKPEDIIIFPVKSLVFFQSSKRKTTFY